VTILQGAFQYFLQNSAFFGRAAQQHLSLSFSALAISLAICLPLGIWAARRVKIGQALIGFFGALRVLPSLAILFLAMPYLGLGFRPALVALSVLACPPVLINTYAGLRGVDQAVVESALGMGMTSRQVLLKIQLPLAAPAILNGVRSASVEVVASATLAAFIGGGGFGDFITRGFALYDTRIMLVGAIPVALLALASELVFGGLQRLARRTAQI
jgi:osmoprotectant transport system permease protein